MISSEERWKKLRDLVSDPTLSAESKVVAMRILSEEVGDRLPSSESLGRDCGFDAATAARLVRELEASGWLTLRHRLS